MSDVGELVVDMVEPSTPAYHLGPIVTAHAAVTTIVAVIISFFLMDKMNLPVEAPLWAAAVVIIPILASEPIRRREQIARFGPANRITLFRAVLISAVAALLGSNPSDEVATGAAFISVIALAMDGLDGWIARRANCMSDYGAQLDMEVDSIFMLLLSVLVYQWDHAGPWVLFCGLARYGWLAAMYFIPWFNRPLQPAFRRKTACVIGIGGLSLALAPWPLPLNTALAGAATATLAASFAIDVTWLIQKRSEPLP